MKRFVTNIMGVNYEIDFGDFSITDNTNGLTFSFQEYLNVFGTSNSISSYMIFAIEELAINNRLKFKNITNEFYVDIFERNIPVIITMVDNNIFTVDSKEGEIEFTVINEFLMVEVLKTLGYLETPLTLIK